MTSLGAAVTALRVPDAKGENPVDVVLGFDTAEDYLSAKNPYFGATVGRVANREEPTWPPWIFQALLSRSILQTRVTYSHHLTMLKIH